MSADIEQANLRSLGLAELLINARRRPATVLAVLALVLLLAFLWVGTRTPRYRASATLLLEQTRPSGGVLGELASLSSAPRATSEIAILQSRRLACQTASMPDDGAIPRPGQAQFDQHMGLETRVDDQQLLPLRTLLTRLNLVQLKNGRLFAQAQRTDPQSEPMLLVSFPAEGRVRCSQAGSLAWLPCLDNEVQDFDFEPGEELTYAGWKLRLETQGDVLGKRFEVRSMPAAEAVNQLLANIKVVETERNSGVLKLTYEDSDPERAAEVANALTQNYLCMSLGRGEQRASQTVSFVQSQLEGQSRALEVAEAEVLALQRRSPESIDVSSTSAALIDRLSALELERMRLDVGAIALGEALEALANGNLGALSRLGQELDDPISLTYISGLTQLAAESASQGRSDSGPYKLLLQTRLAELEAQADRDSMSTRALAQLVGALRRGEPNALAQMGVDAGPGQAGNDPLTNAYMQEIGRLTARLATLSPDLAQTNPELELLRQSVAELEARVLAQLEGQLQVRQRAQAEQLELVEAQRSLLASYPAQEQGRIESAIEALTGRTTEHLRQRLIGLDSRRSALDAQREKFETDLRRLPESELALAGPLRKLETHKAIVQFLLMSQQEAEITRASTLPSADFIDPAMTPSVRSWPRMGMSMVLALLLGLALGLGSGHVHESLCGGLRTESELELASGLQVLGVIPDYSRNAAKSKFTGSQFLALRDDPDGQVAEAFRSLRAALRFAAGDTPIRTLAVTSCVSGEGKSVTNIHLAMTFASAGARVLLVDADMRQPSLCRYFDFEQQPGLAEVLQSGLDWRPLVQQPGHPNLSVLSAGKTRVSAGDLLAGERMHSLIDEFLADYELVVFDVPPALVVADIEGFSHKLDALLLLYRSESLPGRVVRSTAQRLGKSGAHLAGVVLNAVKARNAENRAYGYQHYGYRQDDQAA